MGMVRTGTGRRMGRTRLKVLLPAVCLVLASCGGDEPPAREAQGSPSFREDHRGRLAISADPRAVTTGPGDRSEIGIEVQYLDGFTSAETDLWVRGAPPGVLAHLERDPLTHSGHSVLLLQADETVVPGRYPIIVGAGAGGERATVALTLWVGTEAGFDLEGVPGMQWVAPGGRSGFEVRAMPRSGFRGPLRWRVDGLPQGVRASVEERDLEATVVLHADRAAAPGISRVVITASSGAMTRSFTPMLGVQGTRSGWRTRTVGSTGARNNTVRVGDARNDGIRRVYVGTVTTGEVYEFTRTGVGWRRRRVGRSPNNQEIHNMTIGKGRGDGRRRIYACSSDGNLYEFSHGSSGWNRNIVGARTDGCYHAEVGKGRNDGRFRVYAARDRCAYEYTWTRPGWSRSRVGCVSSNPDIIAHGLVVGRGRGGSRNRVYVASDAVGTFEASFTNGRWRMRRMGDDGDIRNVSVGPGRNDRRQRVYAAVGGGAGYVREFTWDGGAWRIRNIGASNPIAPVLVHVYAAKGRNDGRFRLYGAGGDGTVYEYTWRPATSHWRRRVVGGSNSYMYGFHFGRARGDSRIRLYGADFGGDVWEFTWQ